MALIPVNPDVEASFKPKTSRNEMHENAGVYDSFRKTFVFIPICDLCFLMSQTLICMIQLSTSHATCVFHVSILEEEKLQENSKIVGTNLLLELAKLQSEFSVIGDVRGKGLMIGIELVKPGTKEALPADRFSKFFEACMNMGLLLGKGGIYGNVLRIQPPMCITKDDADFTIAVMRKAFQDL